MAFKNEYVPPQEQETSEFLKQAQKTLKHASAELRSTWTVDRERDMVLFRRGGGMISTPQMRTTGVLLIARASIPSPLGSCRRLKSPRKRLQLRVKLAWQRASQTSKRSPVSRRH